MKMKIEQPMRDLVATSPSTKKNLILETAGVMFNGEPRTMLIIEALPHEEDGDALSEIARFSLTVDRIDALISELQRHRAILVASKHK